ncbi:MAG: ABC transporter ATP-binding protein [Flavobacteriaceae bacterium]
MILYLNKIRQLLSRRQKKALLLLAFLLVIGMFFEVLGLGVLLPMITLILNPSKVQDFLNEISYLDSLTIDQNEIVWGGLILIVGTYLVKTFFLVFITYKQNAIIEGLGAHLSMRLYRKYLYQSYSYHINRDLSEIIKNIQIEIGYYTFFCNALLMLMVEIALTISVLATVVYIEPMASITVACLFGLLAIIYIQSTKRKIKKWGDNRQNLDKNISKIILESLSGIKQVKLLSKEMFFKNQYDRTVSKRAKISSSYQTFIQLPRFYLELIAVLGLVVFIQIMFYKGSSSQQIISTLGLFVAATFRMIPSINRILSSLQNLKYYSSSIDVIFKEFKNEKEIVDDSQPSPIDFKHQITIQDLFFSYENQEVLKSINIKIEKGETVGIIGESGSGKSTLVDLINGLLVPTKGTIYVDNIDINAFENNWKEHLGYVGQDIFLLDDTIVSNVAFGIEKDRIDESRLDYALKTSQINEFVEGLPEGKLSNVGERGVKLSGGQKQRIGIARALYNTPEVLIFDEATAALDGKTEKEVINAIYSLKNKKTIIMIAHRLSTLSKCDKIYEIKKGEAHIKEKINVV